MIYVTGDTHGRFGRLQPGLYGQPQLTAEDTLIICGDFGGIWMGDEAEEEKLNALTKLPYTILFADGNHENYDLLDAYPVSEWHGGKVQIIRPNLIHLMRGQIYDIEGKSFFVMGGAACHDVFNGILDPEEPDFPQKYRRLRAAGRFFRVKGASWWERELPSEEELAEGLENLRKREMQVDYVITHCAPDTVQTAFSVVFGRNDYPQNRLTAYLGELYDTVTYKGWFCGHYHVRAELGKVTILYENTVPIPE